jgi:methionine-rich copper-binding protein CopC
MTLSFRRAWPLALLMVVALTLLSAGIASAHADLKSSIPAAGATVATAPQKVVAVFTEALKAEGKELKVTDASGAVVDMGDTTLDKSDADRTTLFVSLKSELANGSYTVNWKNTSTDGHTEAGSFTFTIGMATAAPAQLPTTGAVDGLPLAAVLVGGGCFFLFGLMLRRRLNS